MERASKTLLVRSEGHNCSSSRVFFIIFELTHSDIQYYIIQCLIRSILTINLFFKIESFTPIGRRGDFLSFFQMFWLTSFLCRQKFGVNECHWRQFWSGLGQCNSKKNNFFILLNLEFVPITLKLILIHTFSSFLVRKWTRTG